MNGDTYSRVKAALADLHATTLFVMPSRPTKSELARLREQAALAKGTLDSRPGRRWPPKTE